MILNKNEILVWVDTVIEMAASGRISIAILELKRLSEALTKELSGKIK